MAINTRINIKNQSGMYDTYHPETNSDMVVVGAQNLTSKLGAIDIAISDKAPTIHTHTKANITDFAHTHTSSDLPSNLGYKDGTLQTNLNAEKVGGKIIKHITHNMDNLYPPNTLADFVATKHLEGYICYQFASANLSDLPTQGWGYHIQVNRIENDVYRFIAHKSTSNISFTRDFNATNKTYYTPWKKILNQDDYDTLFQYANNGKTSIANAIGDTNLIGQTHQQLADNISWCKGNLVTNLNNKGITGIASTNKLEDLVWRVSQISTGKKFASGSVTTDSPYTYTYEFYDSTSTTQYGKLVVSGLGFTPSMVVIMYPSFPGGGTPSYTVYAKNAGSYSELVMVENMTLKAQKLNSYVNATGFSLPSKWNSQVYWFAYE